jgi:murein DD-endopeptidase MepM/ murein hydrolase activator NlpD
MNPTTTENQAARKAGTKTKYHGPGRFSRLHDKIVCDRTVRHWQRVQKRQEHSSHRRKKLERQPYIRVIGMLLYMIGFWAEYMGVCTLRTTGRVFRAILQHTGSVLLMIVRPFAIGLITFCEDLASPFVRFASGLHHIREISEKKQDTNAHLVRKEKIQYFKRGAKLYMPLVWNALSYLLPAAATVFLVLTVQRGLAGNYILNVQVNGQSVGYVASEQVFESAREDVQSRITTAKAAMEATGAQVSDTKWEINPTYTLSDFPGAVMTENDVTDAILRASSSEISDGTAVYIDGSLSYVTTEGDHLRSFLENIRAPYEDALDPNKRVEFVHDIRLVDGVYFTSSITSYDSILGALNASDGTSADYTVQEGDTLQSVESQTGLSFENLQQLNPQIDSAEYVPTAGDSLVVAQDTAPLLQVKTVVRTSVEEAVQYSSQTIESDDYDYGKTVTVQEGVAGLQETTYDITYINGQVSDTNIVNITRLQDPVNEIIAKGTKLKNGSVASYGSGTWVWPVPQYTYVSRWMSAYHTGTDICAPYGVDILASDSGVVVTAGTHYSYGNYVVIDHGNGYKTLYAHMSSIAVSVGQAVTQKQVIGHVGSTGDSTGNHCHFEMYYNGQRFSAQQVFGGM